MLVLHIYTYNATADWQDVDHDLSNSAIFNDLEWPMTTFYGQTIIRRWNRWNRSETVQNVMDYVTSDLSNGAIANTIRHDSVYLTCSKKLTDSQLNTEWHLT